MDPGYDPDLSHLHPVPDARAPLPEAKLEDLTQNELIELIQHLERELVSRDAALRDIVNHQLLYQAKYGRFNAGDPFNALQRDSTNVTNDSFDHNQVRLDFDNQLHQLEALIETQRRAQAKVKEQKQAADERFRQVCRELEEAKRKYERDTARGDDVTVALEKEREKLHHDLAFAKDGKKKLEKELKKVREELKNQLTLASRHKQVAMEVIKERRRMVAKLAESERLNKAVAEALQLQQRESARTDQTRLDQLEAKMEKQSLEFDIEREQYKARLRREECKVRDLVQQLNDIKETVLSLQSDSNNTSKVYSPNKINPASVPVEKQSFSIIAPSVPTSTVTQTSQRYVPATTAPVANSQRNPPATTATVSSPPSQRYIPTTMTTASLSPSQLSPMRQSAQTSNLNSSRLLVTAVKPVTSSSMSPTLTRHLGVVISSATVTSVHTKLLPASTVTVASHTSINSTSSTGSSRPASSITISNSAVVRTPPSPVTTSTNTLSTSSNRASTYTNQTRPIATNITPKPSVPPHLGAKAILENQTGNLGNRISLNMNTGDRGVREEIKLESALLSKSGPIVIKPKPPPPVRNVSLPPSKKQYGQLGGLKSPVSTISGVPASSTLVSNTNSSRQLQRQQLLMPETSSAQ